MYLMKLSLSTCTAGLLYLSSLSIPALVSQSVGAAGPGYTPPQVGAPSRRVGGGTRGVGDAPPFLAVLAPESAALTLSAQPTLYWALSEVVTQPIEVMLVETNPSTVEAMKPLLEKKLDVTQPGIHKISLSEQGVTLKQGVEYEWFVSLLGQQRHQDVLTSGVLKYVDSDVPLSQSPTPQTIAECLQAQKAEAQYQQYLNCGVWYDGMAQLSEEIAQGQTALKAVRRELMKTVALPKVAGLDQ